MRILRLHKGDVVEKFTATPRVCLGNLPQRSVIVGVGPPLHRPTSEAAFAT
jgi:hypothetical protein